MKDGTARAYRGRLLRSTALAGLAVLAASPALAFVTDGKFGGAAEGYTLGFDVTFNTDSGPVSGGKLFFGTDTAGTGDHFLYFAMPKDFVDNTWGANAVDWGSKGHTFDNLLGSDSLGNKGADALMFKPVNADPLGSSLDVRVDYLAQVKEDVIQPDGKKKNTVVDYISGGIGPDVTLAAGQTLGKNEAQIVSDTGVTVDDNGTPLDTTDDTVVNASTLVKEIATSLEYNVQTFKATTLPNGATNPTPITADDIKNKTGLLADSPEVQVDASGKAILDANGNYQVVNSAFSDYVFEVGYEFRFDAKMFDNRFTDPNEALAFVMLGESHVSPSKENFVSTTVNPVCTFGTDCPETQNVPEPGTAAAMVAGLIGLWGLRRRHRPT